MNFLDNLVEAIMWAAVFFVSVTAGIVLGNFLALAVLKLVSG